MKKLILLTTLLFAGFAYAGEGDAKKSCDTDKKCCCCESCEGAKPEGKCCCADEAKEDKAPVGTPAEK